MFGGCRAADPCAAAARHFRCEGHQRDRASTISWGIIPACHYKHLPRRRQPNDVLLVPVVVGKGFGLLALPLLAQHLR